MVRLGTGWCDWERDGEIGNGMVRLGTGWCDWETIFSCVAISNSIRMHADWSNILWRVEDKDIVVWIPVVWERSLFFHLQCC